MDSEVDVIGVGGAGGFLVSSLYRGGLRPRIISRGAALRQLREVGLRHAVLWNITFLTDVSLAAGSFRLLEDVIRTV